jgi:hypothetical protein
VRRGQAVVEVCVALPMACALALLAAQGLAGASAAIAVEHALDRAVIAAAAGGDPVDAARRALPARLARRARIARDHDRVRVTVDVPGPVGELVGSARIAAP